MKSRIIVVTALVLAGLGGCGSVAASGTVDLDRLREQGVAPDLVYLVDLPGYRLVEQSMGVIDEEGFGVFYTSPDGRQVELRVDRGGFDDQACAGMPVQGVLPADAEVTCVHDDAGWYRTAGDRHEYVAVRGEALIRLGGKVSEVSRAALKAAVAGAHRAVDDGTASPTPPRGPVPRGDLPSVGDGAPRNEVGPGG